AASVRAQAAGGGDWRRRQLFGEWEGACEERPEQPDDVAATGIRRGQQLAADHQCGQQDTAPGGDHRHGRGRQAGLCPPAHHHCRGPGGTTLMALADRLLSAWYRGHPGLALLRPLEALYRRVVERKRAAFLAGEGDIYRSPVPIIVVGNITVGGTGKTPMILWLIAHCRARGLRAGVVSRGYGAKPPSWPWRVTAEQPASEAGDEPSLIVRRTGVALVIDPDRPRAVRALLEQETLDIILCDDGLQHYRLARDLELVLIDAARGLGNRRCLPAGPLREPVERLASVDALLYNGALADEPDGYAFTLTPTELVRVANGEQQPLSHFPAGQALHAVAGIGNPQRFFRSEERRVGEE